MFADASKGDSYGQLGLRTVLLFGELKNESIFHAVSWISHKSKRPVKSVPTAEILASSETIYESKSIAHAFFEILHTDFGVYLFVYSKYFLLRFLTTEIS